VITKVLESSELPPPSPAELDRAQKVRYDDYNSFFKSREHWLGFYPELKLTADICQDKLEKTAARKRGCTNCAKNNITKKFTIAFFTIVNKNPDAMSTSPLYRPQTMIRGARKFYRLEEIVAGVGFDS